MLYVLVLTLLNVLTVRPLREALVLAPALDVVRLPDLQVDQGGPCC